MAYKELKELYYGTRQAYQEAYTQRFSSDNAIHPDFDIEGYPAFFLQCDDVIQLSYQILKLDKEIYKLRTSLPQASQNAAS